MKNRILIGVLSAVGLALAYDDWSETTFACGDETDYIWEGPWLTDNTWKHRSSATVYTRDQLGQHNGGGSEEWRRVDFLPGDIYYSSIAGNSHDDWHASVLQYFDYAQNTTTPVARNIQAVGCQSYIGWDYIVGAGECLDDATKGKTVTLSNVNFSLSTHGLYQALEKAQVQYTNNYNGEGNKKFRGARHPGIGHGWTWERRAAVISTASSIENHDIDYTFLDMLENKWSWNWGIPDQDWSGTVGDIDEIRCDGVAEYAWEKHGSRVWGADDNWDIANGSDHNLNQHNYLWDGANNRGEVSPAIQGGCGMYGDGGRSTVRDHRRDGPRASSFTVGWSYYFVARLPSTWAASDIVRMTVQVYSGGTWWNARELGGGPILNRSVVPNYNNGNTFLIEPSTAEYVVGNNQKWRTILIDKGGNATILETVHNPTMAFTNDTFNWEFVAQIDGEHEFVLSGIPAGADFDLFAYNNDYGNRLIGTSTAGGNANDVIKLFLPAHTRVQFVVKSYSGSGGYTLTQRVSTWMNMRSPQTMHKMDASNGYSTTIAIPANVTGLGVTWGEFASALDVGIEVRNSSGTVISSSTGRDGWEYLLYPGGVPSGSTIRVFETSATKKTAMFRLFHN